MHQIKMFVDFNDYEEICIGNMFALSMKLLLLLKHTTLYSPILSIVSTGRIIVLQSVIVIFCYFYFLLHLAQRSIFISFMSDRLIGQAKSEARETC